MDAPLKPLFPFGYGLSYTNYEYSQLAADVKDGNIHVSVTVKNSGECAGVETVQVYVQDVVGTMARPVRELKGYKKVFLKPDESVLVKIPVPIDSIGYYNEELKYVVEPGEFKIWVGHDSETELNASVYVD